MMKFRCLFLICFFCLSSFSQENVEYGRIKKRYYESKIDTQRVMLLDKLIENSPEDIWPKYNDTLIDICLKKINSNSEQNKTEFFRTYLGIAYNNKAIELSSINKTIDAIGYFELSIQNISAEKNPTLTLYVLENLGGTYEQLGQYNNASKVYAKVLEKSIKQNNSEGIVSSCKFLGSLAYRTKDIKKAKKYYYEGIDICKKNDFEDDLSIIYNDLGLVYKAEQNLDSSIYLFEQCYLLRIKNKNYAKAATAITTAAVTYLQKSDPQNAKRCLALAEDILKNYNNKTANAYLKLAYANFYLNQKQYNKALDFGEEAWNINANSDDISLKLSNTNVLYSVYIGNKNYEKALKFYILNKKLSDSLNIFQMKNNSNELGVKFEYEKKTLADSLKREKERAISNYKITQQQKLGYILVGVIAIISALGLVIFRRFKISIKQKAIIEKQKHEVDLKNEVIEVKQKEIIESIKYAKRIQEALLPSEKYIERNLNKTKPKI